MLGARLAAPTPPWCCQGPGEEGDERRGRREISPTSLSQLCLHPVQAPVPLVGGRGGTHQEPNKRATATSVGEVQPSGSPRVEEAAQQPRNCYRSWSFQERHLQAQVLSLLNFTKGQLTPVLYNLFKKSEAGALLNSFCEVNVTRI